ncbi:hypothetical protein C8T65DRAFT_745548 [Cerioporus squamosus]|nr:hypothetical protein C8T65DRAFT_745548 [Cerioporus squamosus]
MDELTHTEAVPEPNDRQPKTIQGPADDRDVPGHLQRPANIEDPFRHPLTPQRTPVDSGQYMPWFRTAPPGEIVETPHPRQHVQEQSSPTPYRGASRSVRVPTEFFEEQEAWSMPMYEAPPPRGYYDYCYPPWPPYEGFGPDRGPYVTDTGREPMYSTPYRRTGRAHMRNARVTQSAPPQQDGIVGTRVDPHPSGYARPATAEPQLREKRDKRRLKHTDGEKTDGAVFTGSPKKRICSARAADGYVQPPMSAMELLPSSDLDAPILTSQTEVAIQEEPESLAHQGDFAQTTSSNRARSLSYLSAISYATAGNNDEDMSPECQPRVAHQPSDAGGRKPAPAPATPTRAALIHGPAHSMESGTHSLSSLDQVAGEEHMDTAAPVNEVSATQETERAGYAVAVVVGSSAHGLEDRSPIARRAVGVQTSDDSLTCRLPAEHYRTASRWEDRMHHVERSLEATALSEYFDRQPKM